MQVKKPKVSVIVLGCNSKPYLDRCLSSLENQMYTNFETIFVDNASNDGSAEFIAGKFAWVRIIRNKKNRGFASGNNIGIRDAMGSYVVFLNSDTAVGKNWLGYLIKAIEKDDGIAIVGSVDSFSRSHGNPALNLIGYHIYGVFKDNVATYAPGFSMIFRKDLVSMPFDEDYFNYGEDVYLSWKMRLVGHKVLIEPKSVLAHFGSGVAGKKNYNFLYTGERNRILNLFTFYELKTLSKVFPLLILAIFLRNVHSVIRRDGEVVPRIRAYLWLLRNVGQVLKKRRYVQEERVVPDREILKYMTCKNLRGNAPLARMVNKLSYIYCHLMQIHTTEFSTAGVSK